MPRMETRLKLELLLLGNREFAAEFSTFFQTMNWENLFAVRVHPKFVNLKKLRQLYIFLQLKQRRFG